MRSLCFIALVFALTACGPSETKPLPPQYLPSPIIKLKPDQQMLTVEDEPISPANTGIPYCEDGDTPQCISDRDVAAYLIALRCWGWRAQERMAAVNEWAGFVLPQWYLNKDNSCSATAEPAQ